MTETATTGDAFDGLPPRCRDCGIAEAIKRLEVSGAGAPTTSTDLCDSCAGHAKRLLQSLGATLHDGSPDTSEDPATARGPDWRRATVTPITCHAGTRPIAALTAPAAVETAHQQASQRPAPELGRGEARPISHEMRGLARDLAVIDTEWTDASIETAQIVSMGIVRLNPDGTGYVKLYTMNPNQPISAGSAAIHHIADENVKDIPDFKAYSNAILEDLAGADLGGYGLKNDVALLEKSFQQVGIDWNPNGIAMVDALRIWQHAERRRLTDAYRRFVGPQDDSLTAHDAADDAMMTAHVLEKLTGSRSMAEIDSITDPDRVDAAGKFRRNEDGAIVFNLGPHRGDDALKHPDYLHWMQYKDFAPSTLRVVVNLLDELYQPVEADSSPEGTGPGIEDGEPDTQDSENTPDHENEDQDYDQIPF